MQQRHNFGPGVKDAKCLGRSLAEINDPVLGEWTAVVNANQD
jgi:hypothetical protein